MSADTRSRHQEWLEGLDPSTRAEVEAEISYYKPDGVWEFDEIEPEDDWEPSGRMGLTVHFSSEEIAVLSRAFGASVQAFEIMHDSVMAQARAALEERGESDSIAAAD